MLAYPRGIKGSSNETEACRGTAEADECLEAFVYLRIRWKVSVRSHAFAHIDTSSAFRPRNATARRRILLSLLDATYILDAQRFSVSERLDQSRGIITAVYGEWATLPLPHEAESYRAT